MMSFQETIKLIKNNHKNTINLYCSEMKGSWTNSSWDMGDERAIELFEALKSNNRIKFVDAENNNIGPRGAQAFGEMLITNKTIEEAILSYNDFNDIGTKAIANAIRYNNKISIINLANNNISDEGAIALAESLANNKTIAQIDLKDNKIGNKGAAAFLKMFETNFTITSFDIENNLCDKEFEERINQYILRNTAIKLINIAGRLAVDGKLDDESLAEDRGEIERILGDTNNVVSMVLGKSYWKQDKFTRMQKAINFLDAIVQDSNTSQSIRDFASKKLPNYSMKLLCYTSLMTDKTIGQKICAKITFPNYKDPDASLPNEIEKLINFLIDEYKNVYKEYNKNKNPEQIEQFWSIIKSIDKLRRNVLKETIEKHCISTMQQEKNGLVSNQGFNLVVLRKNLQDVCSDVDKISKAKKKHSRYLRRTF